MLYRQGRPVGRLHVGRDVPHQFRRPNQPPGNATEVSFETGQRRPPCNFWLLQRALEKGPRRGLSSMGRSCPDAYNLEARHRGIIPRSPTWTRAMLSDPPSLSMYFSVFRRPCRGQLRFRANKRCEQPPGDRHEEGWMPTVVPERAAGWKAACGGCEVPHQLRRQNPASGIATEVSFENGERRQPTCNF